MQELNENGELRSGLFDFMVSTRQTSLALRRMFVHNASGGWLVMGAVCLLAMPPLFAGDVITKVPAAVLEPAIQALPQSPQQIPGLPEPVTASHFEALKSHSPFLRSVGLSDSIVLTGMAPFEGDLFATLF